MRDTPAWCSSCVTRLGRDSAHRYFDKAGKCFRAACAARAAAPADFSQEEASAAAPAPAPRRTTLVGPLRALYVSYCLYTLVPLLTRRSIVPGASSLRSPRSWTS